MYYTLAYMDKTIFIERNELSMMNIEKLERTFVISINENLEIPVVRTENNKISLIEVSNLPATLSIKSKLVFESEYMKLKYLTIEKDSQYKWISIEELINQLDNSYEVEVIKYFWDNLEEWVVDKKVLDSYHFVKALRNNDIVALRAIPKSDLHNHIPYGGSREVIYLLTRYKVPVLDKKLISIPEMNQWCKDNIKGKLTNANTDYALRALAAFIQAKKDGITVFAPNFGLCARKHFDSYNDLIYFIQLLKETFSDCMQIYPELCFDRHKYDPKNDEDVLRLLKSGVFYSIDVTGDEMLGVKNFAEYYNMAGYLGIIRRAHVGEFGDSNTVKEAIDILGLDMLQHGLSIIEDRNLMQEIYEKNIGLTICPTSNVMLSRVESYESHPIRIITNAGIKTTICSDDILIFDSDVSNEYLKLYKSKTLNEIQLNAIRINGLNYGNNR